MPEPAPGGARRSRRPTRPAAAALLSVSLLVGVTTVLVPAAPSLGGWWDAAGAARNVEWDELRSSPDRLMDVTLSVPARFVGRADTWAEASTTFPASRWSALRFAAGDVEQEALADAPTCDRVFVRRGGLLDMRLRAVASGDPVLLRAVIRDVIDGEPWMEVLRVTAAGDEMTPEERATKRRADRFLDRHNPTAAAALYRGLLHGRQLRDDDAAGLHFQLARALLDDRRMLAASAELRVTLDLMPEHAEALALSAQIEARLAQPVAPLVPTSGGSGDPYGPRVTLPNAHAGLAGPSISIDTDPVTDGNGKNEPAETEPAETEPEVTEPDETEAEKDEPAETPPPVPPVPPAPGLEGPR